MEIAAVANQSYPSSSTPQPSLESLPSNMSQMPSQSMYTQPQPQPPPVAPQNTQLSYSQYPSTTATSTQPTTSSASSMQDPLQDLLLKSMQQNIPSQMPTSNIQPPPATNEQLNVSQNNIWLPARRTQYKNFSFPVYFENYVHQIRGIEHLNILGAPSKGPNIWW
jgi:hypothetical protein